MSRPLIVASLCVVAATAVGCGCASPDLLARSVYFAPASADRIDPNARVVQIDAIAATDAELQQLAASSPQRYFASGSEIRRDMLRRGHALRYSPSQSEPVLVLSKDNSEVWDELLTNPEAVNLVFVADLPGADLADAASVTTLDACAWDQATREDGVIIVTVGTQGARAERAASPPQR